LAVSLWFSYTMGAFTYATSRCGCHNGFGFSYSSDTACGSALEMSIEMI